MLAAGAVANANTASAAASSTTTIAGLTPADRHLLRRFSYGIHGILAGQVRDAGNARAWFNQQLDADTIPDGFADEVDSWFPSMWYSPQQMWNAYASDRSLSSARASEELARWTLNRRIRSNRQVLEVMTEFWSNFLHVASPDDSCWPYRPAYDQVIRQHALGRFDEMLQAAITHPAMLLYLDNYASTKDAPNENLGRELLECHTVGRETPYTEADVLNSTRILTGWAVDRGVSWRASYETEDHYTGSVRVLGFQHDNAAPDGRAATAAYLSYLANHPATARRIAKKLVARFVADVPPGDLVDAVAATFTASGTDIKATLRTLVNHPSFVDAARPKVRTPTEDFVATARALRVQALRPRSDSDFARQCIWSSTDMGQRPFSWPTPDGFPDAGAAWSSATRMIGSWGVHHSMAFGNPSGRAVYRDKSLWLPHLPARFEDVVRFASARLLMETPTPAVVAACCEAVGVDRNDIMTPRHLFVVERVPLLLACLLDSPLHMTR